jgi:hypothetical protein
VSYFAFYVFYFFFYKIGKQGTGQVLRGGRGGGTSGKGEMVGKGIRRVNMVKKCVHMYVNAKMISTETLPGIRGGANKVELWRG